MKKTSLISLSSYCPQARAWSVQDLIKEAVNKEDQINHSFHATQIPKMVNNDKMEIKEGVGLWNLITGCLP